MDLKQKGQNAQLGTFNQLRVVLQWTAAVDLDLMAFYKAKDGRVGGVFSTNYKGGSLGDLNGFPYMQLSGDEGVGDTAGDNREILLISRLDDLESLIICAVNFTSASTGESKVFAEYDARVEIMTDKGESHTITLDASGAGSVAAIASFDAGFLGAQVANSSDVMDWNTFRNTVPGANAVELSSKIVLKRKGESAPMKGNDFHTTMRWRAAVDLDLHCFYQLKGDGGGGGGGFFAKFTGGGGGGGYGHVYFNDRGSKTGKPWIYLDQDAGVGDKGGDNEENMYLTQLDKVEHAIIAVNIYGKPNAVFASYDGVVIVRGGGQEFEVPLSEKAPGSWCVIARIDNTGDKPRLINVNTTTDTMPTVEAFKNA